MEYGEGVIEGACREVKEETGLVVEPDGLLGVYSRIPNEEVHLVGFVFLAACEDGEVCVSEDVLAAKWIAVEDVLAMDEEELLGAARLRRILSDTAAGKRYPLDLVC